MGLLSLLNAGPVTTAIISEGIKLAIMLFSNLSLVSGRTPDELKAIFDESYEGLKKRDPANLPDV